MSDHPVLTQRLQTNLNGGTDYSVLVFEILADGKETGIRRQRTTDGRPNYRITDDILTCGGETLDLRVVKGNDALSWALARIKPATSGQPTAGEEEES